MAIVEQSAEEIAELQAKISEWVAFKSGDANSHVTDLRRPSGSGFSNDTLLCNLVQGEKSKPIVLRLAPPKGNYQVFPFYDIPRQFDIMQALDANTDTLVPKMLWKETDPKWLGVDFYAMDFCAGQIPTDNPPYPIEGFVSEATPEQRARLWWSGIEAMAKMHCLDWHDAGLTFLAWPENDCTPLQNHIEYYEHYLNWAAAGKDIPVLFAALEWLKNNQPSDVEFRRSCPQRGREAPAGGSGREPPRCTGEAAGAPRGYRRQTEQLFVAGR